MTNRFTKGTLTLAACWCHLRTMKNMQIPFSFCKSFHLIAPCLSRIYYDIIKKLEWYFFHSGRMKYGRIRISGTFWDCSNNFLLNSHSVPSLGKTKSAFQTKGEIKWKEENMSLFKMKNENEQTFAQVLLLLPICCYREHKFYCLILWRFVALLHFRN